MPTPGLLRRHGITSNTPAFTPSLAMNTSASGIARLMLREMEVLADIETLQDALRYV